jgi:hypothetical protein
MFPSPPCLMLCPSIYGNPGVQCESLWCSHMGDELRAARVPRAKRGNRGKRRIWPTHSPRERYASLRKFFSLCCPSNAETLETLVSPSRAWMAISGILNCTFARLSSRNRAWKAFLRETSQSPRNCTYWTCIWTAQFQKRNLSFGWPWKLAEETWILTLKVYWSGSA